MTSSAGGEGLLGELGGLLSRLDPVPPELLDRVRRAFCWRTIDAELAELSFDSLVDTDSALSVRGADTALEPRMLGFGAVLDGADFAIEVEVDRSGRHGVLVGQLWPAGASAVDVQSSDGRAVTVPVDGLGRFRVDPVPAGPVRLRVQQGRRAVQTTWVSYLGG